MSNLGTTNYLNPFLPKLVCLLIQRLESFGATTDDIEAMYRLEKDLVEKNSTKLFYSILLYIAKIKFYYGGLGTKNDEVHSILALRLYHIVG